MTTEPSDTGREEPLTARNQFRTRRHVPRDLVTFASARSLLPEPLLPDRPGWVEMYWRAWEVAWRHLRRPAPQNGFISNYMVAPAGDRLSMWDSAFTVHFGLYARRAFRFIDALDNFYARQHPDGFICRELCTDGQERCPPFAPNSTGPNILAWAEWNYFRSTGDDSRLSSVFWPLLAYHRWLRAHRTWPNRLYWATGISSGMPNQMRIPSCERYHHHWTWVDATMQASLNCLILGQIAQLLKQDEPAQELGNERVYLLREVNDRLWSIDARFYLDRGPQGEFSPVKSIAAYWGLLDKDMVPADRLNSFVQHLREPEEFNRPHRIPTQSADSPGYNAETGGYWQGGVWAPTNYVVLKGLRAQGLHRLAHEIALNHLENIFRVFQHTDTLWENYAPESAAPGNPAEPNYVGWTGLSPIAVLLEDVIGLQVDWPLRRIVWDRRLVCEGPYGVRNYPLGADGNLDLIGTNEKITVRTNVPFTLTVLQGEAQLQTAAPAGISELTL